MKRRFIIGIDGISAENITKVHNYFNKHGFWWHWIGGLWLFVTRDTKLTTTSIDDAINELETSPNARTFVMEIHEDISWTTRGKKNKKGRDMSDWLKETWASND
jgi:hypothetical protein